MWNEDKYEDTYEDTPRKSNKKGVAGGIAVAALLIIFVGSIIICLAGFDVVNASHVGVKNRFGVLHGTMTPGMAWTGLFMHVEQYNLRMRQMTVEMFEGEKTALSVDGQMVKARIEINYRLSPDNIQEAYSRIGKDKYLANTLMIDGVIREGFKSTVSKYRAEEVWQNRQKVKEEAIAKISNNFPVKYFVLENVVISDIDFNKAFLNAIELEKTNERLALAKEKEVEIEKNEADRKIAFAFGESESKKLAAEAEAYALNAKRKELTPLMVQNNWIDAWNGALPQYMLGDDTSILMSMGG